MGGTQCYPPSLNLKPGDVDSWDWEEVLLDHTAYIDDERNHTSARCELTDKEREMQVTFWLAPPPRVSYFCLAYSHRKPTEFAATPRVIAAEANLALISLRHHSHWRVIDTRTSLDYFVYHAVAGQSPKLTRLPHPDPKLFLCGLTNHYFRHEDVGILRYRSSSGGQRHKVSATLGRCNLALGCHQPVNHDDYDAYKIVTLAPREDTSPYQYDLYTYDSEADAWGRKDTAFSEPTAITTHICERVITIGGTMGWVDLWRGILLCDVHPSDEDAPARLRYIELPEFDQPENQLPLCGTASYFRDIAVVQDRIKFVALQLHARPGSCIPEAWTAATWSTTVDDLNWRKDCELHSSDTKGGVIGFYGLFVGHPKLSLHDDNIIYLMTKVDRWGDATRVITVDMKNKELLDVADYATLRGGMDYAYTRSAISKYLRPPPPAGSTGNANRRGVPLLAYSCKKLEAYPLMSMQHSRDRAMQHSGYHGHEVQDPLMSMQYSGYDGLPNGRRR